MRSCLICGQPHHTRQHHAVMDEDIADLDASIGMTLSVYGCLFIAALLLAAIGC